MDFNHWPTRQEESHHCQLSGACYSIKAKCSMSVLLWVHLHTRGRMEAMYVPCALEPGLLTGLWVSWIVASPWSCISKHKANTGNGVSQSKEKAAAKTRTPTLSPHKIAAASFQLTRNTLSYTQPRDEPPVLEVRAAARPQRLENLLRLTQPLQAAMMCANFQCCYPSLTSSDTWSIHHAGRWILLVWVKPICMWFCFNLHFHRNLIVYSSAHKTRI